jgi:hypothetical protein
MQDVSDLFRSELHENMQAFLYTSQLKYIDIAVLKLELLK